MSNRNFLQKLYRNLRCDTTHEQTVNLTSKYVTQKIDLI